MKLEEDFLKPIADFFLTVRFCTRSALPFLNPLVIIGGDFIQIALPAIAILFDARRYYKSEVSGWEVLNTVMKVLLTSIATHLIKKITKGTAYDLRPNGQRGSFPSGHTSAVFGGAFLIHQIFGSTYARYAYGLACCTAFTRIYGRYHHFRDVAAGALTALSMNLLVDAIIPRQNHPIIFNNMLLHRQRAPHDRPLPIRM